MPKLILCCRDQDYRLNENYSLSVINARFRLSSGHFHAIYSLVLCAAGLLPNLSVVSIHVQVIAWAILRCLYPHTGVYGYRFHRMKGGLKEEKGWIEG